MEKTDFLSVVVCTYNREKYIGRCLEHLQRQGNKHAYEVIIIDNNSSDATAAICKSFIAKHSEKKFRYYVESNQGLSFARNRGIREAVGNLIAFIDDDAFVGNGYIANLIVYFSKHEHVMAIGGAIQPIYESKEPVWMSKYLLPLVAAQDMGEKAIPFKGRKFPIGANMAFRKIVFEKYGMFNIHLGRKGSSLEGGEEKELFLRLKSNQHPVHYLPNVKVEHVIPDSRTTSSYIKKQAIGIGLSEKKRLTGSGSSELMLKIVDEATKIAGSVLLFLGYTLRGRFPAGLMLVKFRYWVIKGLIQ